RDLGMDRRILRRDFLGGVAVGITGAYAAAVAPALAAHGPAVQPSPRPAAAYPPALTGLRGNYPAAVAAFGEIQPGAYRHLPPGASRQPPPVEAAGAERYDLVIVGAGISGLSAAHFWRRALGPAQKILILDNHDDFGGHAKRNEFTYGGRAFVGYGGTMGIATPYPYSYTAKRLVEELGIEVERNQQFQNRGAFETLKLGPAIFFDKEHFGEDRVVAGNGRIPWPEFFAKAPLSDAVRADLIRLHGKNPDYLAGMSDPEKIPTLPNISWPDFLLKYAKVHPDAILFFRGQGGRNNKRVDTTPALEAARRGSVGFNGLGVDREEGFREASYTFHFPDGNASIARMLVSRLVPAACSGPLSMNTVVHAALDYGALDTATAPVRIRLSSSVVRVLHEGEPDRPRGVRVAYVRDGNVHAVYGANVILACNNRIIPALMPELPERQRQALEYAVKVPMMYNNVLIKRWSAFAKLGASNIN